MVYATSQQEFSDADFRIVDNGDQSKKVALDVSGVTAATTRTLTVPNASGTIALTSDLTGYQPLDSDLTSWAAITRASGFDTFATTPNSANFAALLTDESGTAGTVPFQQTGTWTPTISSITGSFNTVTGQAGNYVRIGSLVLAWYVFTTNVIGTAATGILVSTPFTIATRAGGAYRNGSTGVMGSVTINTSTTVLQQQYNGVFGAAAGDTFAGFMAFNA